MLQAMLRVPCVLVYRKRIHLCIVSDTGIMQGLSFYIGISEEIAREKANTGI